MYRNRTVNRNCLDQPRSRRKCTGWLFFVSELIGLTNHIQLNQRQQRFTLHKASARRKYRTEFRLFQSGYLTCKACQKISNYERISRATNQWRGRGRVENGAGLTEALKAWQAAARTSRSDG